MLPTLTKETLTMLKLTEKVLKIKLENQPTGLTGLKVD